MSAIALSSPSLSPPIIATTSRSASPTVDAPSDASDGDGDASGAGTPSSA